MKQEHGPVQAALFDLDETLVDRGQSLSQYARAFVAHFASNLPQMSLAMVDNAIRRADGDGYRPRDDLFVELSAVLPWRVQPDIAALRIHWQTVFPRCAAPMPGLWALRQALQRAGIKLGLITNGGTVVQNLKINALGIRPAMAAILVSEALGLAKPDPRMFHLALEQLGVAPSQAVYVGDHPVVDVQGAREAGLTAIWLRRSIPWPAGWSPPIHQVDTLADVISVIRAL